LPQPDTVIQVIPRLEAGGAERTAVDVAAALARRGVRALVLSEGGRLVAELERAGGVFRPLPAASKNPAVLLRNAGRIAAIAGAESAVLLHARSRAPAWSTLLASRRLRLPFVTTYHGAYTQTGRLKALYNSVMARGDAVIANSRYTEELILSRHPAARGRTAVIYRGTDLARFDPREVPPERPAALRRAWGVPPDAPLVLLPARLTPWKGGRDLVDAAGLLTAGGVAAHYVLAGDPQGRGDYVAELRERIAAQGLGGRVHIAGHVDDMAAAFAAAQVVVVPSVEPEAFGRSAVEAQAMGCPVVASDLGAARETVLGPPEVAPEERTGWRTPPGQPAALAAAIREALELGTGERAELAARARAHVARRFTLEAMTQATLLVYEALLGRPLRGRAP